MLPSNLSAQRVFIVGDNSLFEEGITHLLTFETDLQVSCVKYTDDLAFLADISQNRPDVILLNECVSLSPARILKLIHSIPLQAGLRIIIIRLSNTIIDVYDMPEQVVARKACERQQFTLTKRDDLVAAVRG